MNINVLKTVVADISPMLRTINVETLDDQYGDLVLSTPDTEVAVGGTKAIATATELKNIRHKLVFRVDFMREAEKNLGDVQAYVIEEVKRQWFAKVIALCGAEAIQSTTITDITSILNGGLANGFIANSLGLSKTVALTADDVSLFKDFRVDVTNAKSVGYDYNKVAVFCTPLEILRREIFETNVVSYIVEQYIISSGFGKYMIIG